MNSSYIIDTVARNHRDDLRREASASRAARRAHTSGTTNSTDYGETRRHHGRAHAVWTWFATAQL